MGDLRYQRIGGTARTVGSAFSLWLCEDHVLQVDASFGAEKYRRWYLREIRAVIVQRTMGRAVWNLVWGIVGGLALAAAAGLASLAAASTVSDGRIPLYILAGLAGALAVLCAVVMLWNSLLGPTCAIFVQTTAGLQPWSVPARVRAANALFVRLRPLIEAAQLSGSNAPSA